MILKKLKPMPKDFLWGASTSAYQVEGANLTHGKGPSVQDIKKVPEGSFSMCQVRTLYLICTGRCTPQKIFWHWFQLF